MTGEEFCRELEGTVYASLDRIGEASAAHEPGSNVTIASLLNGALKNEIEASEEAALWMSTTPEVDVKLALARQCGDEAKHYRLIEDRLRDMGHDPSDIDPLADGYSPMFQYLETLETTVERIAAGQFTREGLAKVRNQVFIEYCKAQGDIQTAELYEGDYTTRRGVSSRAGTQPSSQVRRHPGEAGAGKAGGFEDPPVGEGASGDCPPAERHVPLAWLLALRRASCLITRTRSCSLESLRSPRGASTA